MGAYYVHGRLQQKPENRGRALGTMEWVFAENFTVITKRWQRKDCSQKRKVFENQRNGHSYLFKGCIVRQV